MAKVSATLRPAASQSGMYIRSRMSFHLVLSVVYGLLTCVTKVFLMSLFQSVVHAMASLQPWFSMQSIVRAALNTNRRIFVTYNSGSLRYM